MKMTAKQYRDDFENSGSTSVFKELPQWLYTGCNARPNGRAEFNNMHKILRDNRRYLIEQYGRQQFCLSDGRRIHVWFFDLGDDTKLWILTANTRGTTLEYVGDIALVKSKIFEVFQIALPEKTAVVGGSKE